ncbi:MAG: DUF2203 domain-containing protein [Candidatus Neomarinimicrobiota bacterium]
MPARRHERHFSLEEAEAALGEIRPLVEELAALKQSLDEEGFRFMPLPEQPEAQKHHTNGHHPPPAAFVRLVHLLHILTEQGIQVRDLAGGLIDFPHIRDSGEEVYLCWRLGEETIAFWHPLDTGFAGREPLATL